MIEGLSPDWLPAVFRRTSRRSFNPAAPLDPAALERLEDLARRFRPFPEARAAVIRRPPDAVLKGILGAYGRISGAPAYAAMIGRAADPFVAERVGYTGQAIVLEATVLGIGTCWVSGLFRPDAVGGETDLEPGERVFAVTPLGIPEDRLTAKDRFYKTLARSRSRRPLSEITSGGEPAPWQSAALEAARLAPSAANRQPWRFEIASGSITVIVSGRDGGGRYPKRLDCGIAMLHLELGARAAGAPGRWTPLAPPAVARYEALAG